MKKYLLSIILIIFVGCGGGGGGSSSSSSSSPTNNGTIITAVDGYIKDATVTDALGNKATYISNGQYRFDSTPTYPLTLAGGKLEDTNLSFDISMTAQSGSDIISPITTFLGNDSTLLSKFANLGLGISTLDEFSVDYINTNNVNLSKLSQLLYVILKDETLTTTFKTNIATNEGSLDNLFIRATTDINSSSLSTIKKSESNTLLTKVKNFTGSASAMENFISDEKTKFQSITHNGVSYNSVISPHTGRYWLDRNLGASSVCTAYNDSDCYGDYYQWGREADGHEKSNSGITSTRATSISVGHASFIKQTSDPFDWTSSDNIGSTRSSNWLKTDGNSICPIGFMVPSFTELKADTVDLSRFDNRDDAYSGFLKLPSSGVRDYTLGSFINKGSLGFIWSSSPYTSDADHVSFSSSNKYYIEALRAYGMSVRCIQEKIAPIANTGNNQTVTEGEAVTLNATLSIDKDGNIVSYEWKEGSTVLSNNQFFTKTNFTIGTHTITLTVTDNHGLIDTDIVSIVVSPNVNPTANAGNNQTITEGNTVTLNSSASTDSDGSIVSYEWKEEDTLLSNNQSFIKSNYSVGIHTITLTVTDNHGATDIDTVIITVLANVAPIANAGNNQIVQLGETVTLNASASTDSDGNIVSYEWKEASTVLSNNQVFTKSDLYVGLHTITLTVIDNHSLTDTDTVFITIGTNPIAHAGSDQTASTGEIVTFNAAASTDSDGTIESYEWKEGSTLLSNNQLFTKSDLSKGVYTITLTITDNHGFTDTDTVSVTITDDHGDNISTATIISDSTIDGTILNATDEDFFKIIITEVGILELFSTGTTDTIGYLYDSSGTELVSDNDSGAGTNFKISYNVTSNTYYLMVKSLNSTTKAPYTIIKNFAADGGPLISSSIPANNDTDIGITPIVIVTFNNSMDETTFTNNITFKDNSDNDVAFTTTYSDKTLKIITRDILSTTTDYTITFNANIKDITQTALTSTNITFTTTTLNTIVHNTVTYGFVKSTKGTEEIWLDRNLGASSVCASSSDITCFGDYYQWGREADGHEKSDSATTLTQATSVLNVGHDEFIKNSYYWTTYDIDGSTQSSSWKKIDGTSICPIGFRVPIISELDAEVVDYNGFSNFLKIPHNYSREWDTGLISSVDEGFLWTTSAMNFFDGSDNRARYIKFNATKTKGSGSRANGYSIRCIRSDDPDKSDPFGF